MDEIMHALTDINYSGAFTFEASNSLRPANTYLGDRWAFEKDTRLKNPSLVLQKELKKYLYNVGKYILEAYGEMKSNEA